MKGGVEMVGGQIIRNVSSSLMLAGLTLIELDCAGPRTMAGPRNTELRETLAVADPAPRLLVAGPALVLHMNLEPRGGKITVFRAPRHDGSAADCQIGPQHAADVVEPSGGALVVSAGESLCATATRPAALSWHARQPAPNPPTQPDREHLHQASLR